MKHEGHEKSYLFVATRIIAHQDEKIISWLTGWRSWMQTEARPNNEDQFVEHTELSCIMSISNRQLESI